MYYPRSCGQSIVAEEIISGVSAQISNTKIVTESIHHTTHGIIAFIEFSAAAAAAAPRRLKTLSRRHLRVATWYLGFVSVYKLQRRLLIINRVIEPANQCFHSFSSGFNWSY